MLFYPSSSLFKMQQLQFPVRIWQYFHRTELLFCQKAGKKKENKIWHF